MPANIATINNLPAIAYVGATPWHRLGTMLHSATDLDAALNAAGLNWRVDARPLYTLDSRPFATDTDGWHDYTGRALRVNAQAITRDTDGQVLGIVTDTYEPIQHLDAFGAFRPALAAGALTIEVAGALGVGEVVWMLTRLPGVPDEVIRPSIDGDRLKPFILASTSHDGSRAFRLVPTATRVVCRNTISAAWSETDGKSRHYTIRHTSGAADAVRELEGHIDHAVEAFRATANAARQMADTPITPEQLRAFVETLMPTPPDPREAAQERAERDKTFRLREQTRSTERERELYEAWLRNVERINLERAKAIDLATYGSGNTGQSVWDAVNGVTEYIDHTARTLASGKHAGTVSAHRAQQTATSAIWGDGMLLKAQAFFLGRKLVAAA